MPIIKDEVGKRYGKLTVVKRIANGNDNHAYYECVCECGNVTNVRGTNLRQGQVRSCGCNIGESTRERQLGKKGERSPIDGVRFGKLVAVKRVENRNNYIMYECVCDCGNKKIARKNDLMSGNVNSCGCLKSVKESNIATLLAEHGIPFERERKFDGLVSEKRKSLRFDFYLPLINSCIEFNGGQHYKSVKYFGGEKRFISQQSNDRIKEEYCRANGMPLLVLNDKNYSDELILHWINNNKKQGDIK